MPLISIITPTYNHQDFIGECIRSALAQTFQDWEQIIIDDGSQDDTPLVIDSFEDPRIKNIRQPNAGRFALADTYAKALNLAQGEFVALLEGDDYWSSNALAHLLPGFTDPAVVVSYGITQVVDSRGSPIDQRIPGYTYLKQIDAGTLVNQPVGRATRALLGGATLAFPCSALLRRTAIDEIGGLQSVADRHAVDFATFLEMSLLGSFYFTPSVVGYWRRHGEAAGMSPDVLSLYRSNYEYVTQFALKYAERLRLSEKDHAAIEKHWRSVWPNIHLTMGKQLLTNHAWQRARNEFIEALKTSTSMKQVLMSMMGAGFAAIHLDPTRRI